jgi:hypothetical protein
MHLVPREKKFLVGACLIACFLGASAGYIVLSDELEHQFHGGVLDEDVSMVMRHNIWTSVLAFAEVAFAAVIVLGVVPIWLRRFLSRGTHDA